MYSLKKITSRVSVVNSRLVMGLIIVSTLISTQVFSDSSVTADSGAGEPISEIAYSQWQQTNAAFIKPSGKDLKTRLTPLQFEVTQEDGTERPFNNEFWDNKQAGIYVDIISGEPLFSSTDKYKSGTGWPSFVRPISRHSMTTHVDKGFFTVRTELRSRVADSHLGHVFEDAPAPTGLRYCINSASLRFIPKEDLEKEGYPHFSDLFVEE